MLYKVNMISTAHCLVQPSPAAPAAIVLLFTALVAGAQEKQTTKKVLPSYIPVCTRAERDLAACVVRAVETLRPRLRGGLRKLRVPPLEPFALPALAVQRDLPALRIDAQLQDLRARGASDFRIRNLTVDPDALTLSAEVVLPAISVESRYEVKGRLLTVPLLGKGNFRGNFSNVEARVSAQGKRSSSGGMEHVVATGLRLALRLGGTRLVDFDNDDPAADNAAAAALAFVRSNTDAVLEVVTPVVEEVAAEVALQMVNSILQRLPLAEILPDA